MPLRGGRCEEEAVGIVEPPAAVHELTHEDVAEHVGACRQIRLVPRDREPVPAAPSRISRSLTPNRALIEP